MSHCFEWRTGKEIQPNIGHNFEYDTAFKKRKRKRKLSFSRKLICLHLIFQFGTYCIKMIAMHWGDRSTGRHYVCIASGGEVFECCNLHSNVKLIITPHTQVYKYKHTKYTQHTYTRQIQKCTNA